MKIVISILYMIIAIAVAMNAKRNGFSFYWYLFFSLVANPIVAKITLNIAIEINSKVVDSPNKINADQEQANESSNDQYCKDKENEYINIIKMKLKTNYNEEILKLVETCYNNNLSIAESMIKRIKLIQNIKTMNIINSDFNTIIYAYFNRFLMDKTIFSDYNKFEFSSCYSDYCVVKDKENQTLLSTETNNLMDIILNGGYRSEISSQLLNVIFSNSENEELSDNNRKTILKYLDAIPTVLKEMYREY